ncbi:MULTISPECIES: 6-carboxytetrahydropterin synthase QueD [Sporomusa]|jgi:6-pyruvoyltetrahydropterin/6-carboxytetrahydropterin synthase|uniref:6-carboxy-5,6,7,8-tetrahydropterin synthase n=2 Tax=Sporomusa TaxID=2375 RepID=A0ABP2C5T8_9FIRM|nr:MULTISPECIES: 6-carboxytetrahydropterin synthase QueD [Sporomusa]MCM0757164.1 6-carboxytetrahydropterin synthase QueD [Sporomusa sphaeroides DSM 2875]OLS58553.1 6-carboxy-5,6,7,8-tetrahydropterin synthase [Sporomusa sphaeroides DSM 2875]CVK19693.1 6-carboxy-5,6,7,8-tetrahydropterin synthase [Sporomusa sphaeroides DSM 2875]SCM80084.1 6-carboxy-5,6,7,8-tetrahydropterin synthase [uncultured Sporomusa sp.]HML34378.1 6-carboxytetrahydropterin synthase QueD [Sporomusa sphaeroides]
MYDLTIIAEFEAAHQLPDYPGKCRRLHGHNWKVEVTVTGHELNHLGMVMDFKDLKAEVNKVIDSLDHYYLNDLPVFKTINPTAENIAKYIYDTLAENPVFQQNVKVRCIQVWESPRSAVKYCPQG